MTEAEGRLAKAARRLQALLRASAPARHRNLARRRLELTQARLEASEAALAWFETYRQRQNV